MPQEAGELSELEVAQIEDMEENILLCKARSVHQMAIVEVREKTWGDEVDWRCDVCGAERHDSYDPHGGVLTRWYKLPPGSRVVGERMYAADFRIELLRRYKLGGMNGAKARRRRR